MFNITSEVNNTPPSLYFEEKISASIKALYGTKFTIPKVYVYDVLQNESNLSVEVISPNGETKYKGNNLNYSFYLY